MGWSLATVHRLLPMDSAGLGSLWFSLADSPILHGLSGSASCHSIRVLLQSAPAEQTGKSWFGILNLYTDFCFLKAGILKNSTHLITENSVILIVTTTELI